jgi:uncharacterized protein involved in exopolysaccharide biosynthesis
MSYAESAATRQPVIELPKIDSPGAPESSKIPEASDRMVARLRLLWSHRRWLARVTLWSLAASMLLAFLIPARYESTARLMPPDSPSSSGLALAAAAMGGGAGGLGGMAGDVLGLKSSSDVFVGILGSRTVEDKLINQFDLKKLYGDGRMEDARRDLAERTAVSVDRKSQIIAVMVTDRSPQRAAAMAQAYVEELNRLVAELSTSSARRERIFLEGRLQAVSHDLEAAEKEFSQFASENMAVDIKEQGKAMFDAAAIVQGQLIAAQSQYEGLRQIYTDNNASVRTVKARIDELQHQLEKLGGKGESTVNVSAQPGESLYSSIRKLSLLGVSYADLYRRTKIQEAVFESLTKEYELAKVQEAKEIPSVKVLDPPNIPEKKPFPPRLLILVMGMAFAFAAASTWVFTKTAWDQTDSSDPRKLFAREVFTVAARSIPHFRQNVASGMTGEEKPRRWFRSRGRNAAHD